MWCNASLGGQIMKIVYEKEDVIIFTLKNVKRVDRNGMPSDIEYYNVIVRDGDLMVKVKKNMYKHCTCICGMRQKLVKLGSKKTYTYDFYLEELTLM